MNQYDLLIFSPPEFELFVKDLLEAYWDVHIEAFADAADGGIDLRFAHEGDKYAIVQCRRWTAQ